MAGNHRSGEVFGISRVLEPKGVLPQAATRLDNSPPLCDNEALIRVATLNIDSASFRQMRESVAKQSSDPAAQARGIGDIVQENVRRAGKQVNPVTGSGGMLIGTVAEVGSRYRGPCALKVGDRVATLISLTLTPLAIRAVNAVHLSGRREAQIDVEGEAFLVDGAPAAVLPTDLPEELALSVLDVCGAPAQVDRLVKPDQTVVVVGAGGKSGLLVLHQARKRLGKSGRLAALDYSDRALDAINRSGLADVVGKCDARDALGTLAKVRESTGGSLADLVFNCANVSHTEMAAILCAKPGGAVYFFNMATDFARAALGAEGIGRDVTLLIGNGFTPGHADLALGILRENPKLFAIFSAMGSA